MSACGKSDASWMQIKDSLGVEGTAEDPVPIHGNPALSAPPKTKPPLPKASDGESDEGSETCDKETGGEEQGEGGSDFESESDKGTDTIKKNLTSILPSKQQSAVMASATVAPAAGAGIPSKRIREVDGKREKEDEPQSKKKRPEVATPASKSAALKVTSYGFVSTILMIYGSSHSSCICEESFWDLNCSQG